MSGFAFLILAFIVVGFGLAAHLMRYTEVEWNNKLVLIISKIHKFGAWTIICIGNIVCYIGIYNYNEAEGSNTFWIIFPSFVIFFIPVLFIEICLLLRT